MDFYSEDVEPFPHLVDGMFNILFVGRLEKRKGLEHLLRAMALIQQLRPLTRLIVVGGFRPGRKRVFQRQVDELGLRNVMFEGFVSETDKRRYLKSSHAFCSPATGGESQGVVLLEAMAAGIAVVASDIPGYRSVLLDGEGALLIPPKDHVALARNLMRLIDNEQKRRQMTAFGLERARQFAWGKIAGRVLAYYDELVNESGIGGQFWTFAPATGHVTRTP